MSWKVDILGSIKCIEYTLKLIVIYIVFIHVYIHQPKLSFHLKKLIFQTAVQFHMEITPCKYLQMLTIFYCQEIF